MVGIVIFSFWKLLETHNIKNRLPIFFLIIVLVFGFDVFSRAVHGYKKAVYASEDWTTAQSPAIIRWMLIPKKNARSYEKLYAEISDYFNKYPEKTMINLTMDAFYSVFAGNRPNAHRVFVNWGDYLKGVYPDYYKDLASFIADNRPLILVPNDAYYGITILQPVMRQCNYRLLTDTDLGFSVMIPPD